MPSILVDLIEKTRNTQCGKSSGKFTKPPLTRIHGFEDYHRIKVRLEGGESDGLRELREFHERTFSPKPRVITKPWTYPYEFDHVFVNTTVSKNGRIKLSITQPFQELYDKYQSKAIQPPIEERVRLMKAARYPEHMLMSAIKKNQKLKKDTQKTTIFLEKIFGKK
jgi:hypothetical protein